MENRSTQSVACFTTHTDAFLSTQSVAKQSQLSLESVKPYWTVVQGRTADGTYDVGVVVKIYLGEGFAVCGMHDSNAMLVSEFASCNDAAIVDAARAKCALFWVHGRPHAFDAKHVPVAKHILIAKHVPVAKHDLAAKHDCAFWSRYSLCPCAKQNEVL